MFHDMVTKARNPSLLVTGASGYLGRSVTARAARSGRHVIGAAFTHAAAVDVETLVLDLSDGEGAERRIVALGPAAIVHAAAVNPGGPEDRMRPVNVGGTAAVARAAARLGCRLVHVSTDVVHDGRRAPYADDAPPSPLSLYARTKAEAEEVVLSTCPRAVIVRTSLIVGLEEIDRSTAGFAERCSRGDPLHLFTDQVRQPIHVDDLAGAVLELADGDVAGFLNVAGRQALTRAEIGRRMLSWWGVEADVREVRSSDLGLRQPTDLRLDLSRALEVLQTPLPGLDAVLARGRARSSGSEGFSPPGSCPG